MANNEGYNPSIFCGESIPATPAKNKSDGLDGECQPVRTWDAGDEIATAVAEAQATPGNVGMDLIPGL